MTKKTYPNRLNKNIATFVNTFAVKNWNVIGGQPCVRLNPDKKWTSPSS